MFRQKNFAKWVSVFTLSLLFLSIFILPDNVYAASKIHLQKSTVNVTYGATYQQKLIGTSGKAIKASTVTWKSQNRQIAKVSTTGKVTALKVGTARMTAKYKGKIYKFTVNVKNPMLKVKTKTLNCGDSFKVSLFYINGNAINAGNIKFSSSDPNVATVISKGMVTAHTAGNAVITLKYKDKKFNCYVTVNHEETVLESKVPTCTDAGSTEGLGCSVCKEILVPQEIIPATGHSEAIDEAVEPTCTLAGATSGTHCSVCAEILIPQEVIPANGHDWKRVYATNGNNLGSEIVRVCKTCKYMEVHTVGETDFVINDNLPNGDGEKVKVILLGGQSNAAGCSYDEYLKKNVSPEKYAEYDKGYDNVYINYFVSGDVGPQGFVNCATRQGEWGTCFGPELGMAEQLNAKYPDEKFFIIKYTWSGTDLYNLWLSPSSSKKAGVLYNEFVKFTELSVQYLIQKNYDVSIEGMCWMQGESDSFSVENGTNYKVHLSNFIKDMRGEFASYASTDGIAFIDATIADNPVYWVYCDLVNQSKREVANESPMNALIDTNAHGLTCSQEPYEQPDMAHYDSLSQIKLGNLFGQELTRYIN